MITLPSVSGGRLWEQNNRSDVVGSLFSSFNLNLTEQLGKTKVSPRMVITTNGITDFGTPVAFKEYLSNLYTIAGNYIFRAAGGNLETAFVKDAQTNSPGNSFSSDISDLEVFNNRLYAVGSGSASFWRLDTTTWTGLSSLSVSVNSKMLNFLKLNRLYIVTTNQQIISMDTGESFATSGSNSFLIKNKDLVITSLVQTSNLLWILTFNQQNGQGYVYSWDGATADTPTDIHPLDSRGALAGIVKDGVLYIIDMDGKLQYFNGQAFVLAPNGRLPIKQFKYLKNPNTLLNNRWIHPNGITLVDGRINILINNENYDLNKTIQESLPSGIWEYDVDMGWYHKNALTQYTIIGATINDYGQNRISRVGALANIKVPDIGSPIVGTLIAGADYFSDSTSSTVSAAWTNDSLDTIQKYGYFVTNKILSPRVQDAFGRTFLRIRKLLNSTDRVIVKARSQDIPALEPVTVTWTSSTSFTTTTDISAYSQGEEVEGTQGPGSGKCAVITSINNNSGTWVVTLDDTLGASNGTSKVRFQHWKWVGTLTNQSNTNPMFNITTSSGWIQIKVCMLFTGNNEFIDLNIEEVPNLNLANYGNYN